MEGQGNVSDRTAILAAKITRSGHLCDSLSLCLILVQPKYLSISYLATVRKQFCILLRADIYEFLVSTLHTNRYFKYSVFPNLLLTKQPKQMTTATNSTNDSGNNRFGPGERVRVCAFFPFLRVCNKVRILNVEIRNISKMGCIIKFFF